MKYNCKDCTYHWEGWMDTFEKVLVHPDFILTGPVAPESLIARFEGKFGKGSYRLRGYLPGDWRDFSRPEIPLHSFGPPPPRPGQRGIALIEATVR